MEQRESDRTFGVVGVGVVGLRLAAALVDHGFHVVGVDVDEERVEALREGRSYVDGVDDGRVERMLAGGFEPTTSYGPLDDAHVVAVCVPTPLEKSGQPDVSSVVDAVERLAALVKPGCTIVVESTVYPGATETLLAELLADAGRTVGEDVYLACSPERVDPGRDEYGLREVPKVVGGVTPQCAAAVRSVYGEVFEELVPVGSATEAEMVKILENTFRNANIALVNELVKVANELGVDFWNVIDAAETKPYGFMPFYPGPGLGGHCIPVDPRYLSWSAWQVGCETPFVDFAARTNREMTAYVVEAVVRMLNEDGVASADADVLLLGAAYKPDVSDARNAPVKRIVELLEDRGASVSYSDPHVPRLTVDGTEYESVDVTPDALRAADCVVVVTDHSAFDVETIVEHSRRIFDTRNATRGYERDTIVRL